MEDNNIEKRSLFKRLFIHSLITYIIILSISILFYIAFVFILGYKYKTSYTDSCFIVSVIWISVGLLNLISKDGFFDMFQYSGKYIVKKFTQRQMETYQDFKDNKEAKKKKTANYSFGPFLAIGLILLVIAIVFSNIIQ
jgi:hypothetical protein